MSDRSDDRKYPLRSLFGVPRAAAREPCVVCNKPETNRVVVVMGDAVWHKSVLSWTGMDNATASRLVVDRWADEVWPLHKRVHQIVSEAGHPEWAPLPETPEGIPGLIGALSWRMCRHCAAGAGNLETINVERLNAIIDEDGEIPHVIMCEEEVVK